MAQDFNFFDYEKLNLFLQTREHSCAKAPVYISLMSNHIYEGLILDSIFPFV